MTSSDTGRARAKALLSAIQRQDVAAIDATQPRFCTVTAVSGNLVSVRTSAATSGGHLIARVQGFPPAVGDRGILMPVDGSSVYIPIDKGLDDVVSEGELATALATKADVVHGHGQTIIASGFTSAGQVTTTNLATLDDAGTSQFTLPPGTWGAVFWGGFEFIRSVNSGACYAAIRIGGQTNSEVGIGWTLATAWSNSLTMRLHFRRTDITVPAGTTDTVQMLFRGDSTAGTTYARSRAMTGFFYKIS